MAEQPPSHATEEMKTAWSTRSVSSSFTSRLLLQSLLRCSARQDLNGSLSLAPRPALAFLQGGRIHTAAYSSCCIPSFRTQGRIYGAVPRSTFDAECLRTASMSCFLSRVLNSSSSSMFLKIMNFGTPCTSHALTLQIGTLGKRLSSDGSTCWCRVPCWISSRTAIHSLSQVHVNSSSRDYFYAGCATYAGYLNNAGKHMFGS